VLGNPPWDTLSPDVKEFFSAYDPSIRFKDKAGQEETLRVLLEDVSVHTRWSRHCRDLYAQALFFKQGGVYTLFAPGNLGKGDFNVFRMFVELALRLTRPEGMAGQVVPEGFYSGANSMAIRQELFEHWQLRSILGFENAREVWFKGIDSRTKFAIYAAKKGEQTDAVRASFSIRTPERLAEVLAGDTLTIPVATIREFSPDALAVMEFAGQMDIDIATRMYARWPKLGDEAAGLPFREYQAELHMGNDRDRFRDAPPGLPVYEGRMVAQYDYRAKGYRGGRGRSADWEEYPFDSPDKAIRPQWWVPRELVPGKLGDRVDRYRVGFCDVTSPTNERSLIAALLPPGVIAGDKVPTITFPAGWEWAYLPWLAVANSHTSDFLVRRKVSLKMSYTVLDSLPFPRLHVDDPLVSRLAPLVLRLSCTGPEMLAYWNQMAMHGWVQPLAPDGQLPGLLDEDQRLAARAEIEVIVVRDLYGLGRAEAEYLLGTFPIVERREKARYGEYRTRRLVLEAFDRPQPQAVVHGSLSQRSHEG
jgi:hypothetical protein